MSAVSIGWKILEVQKWGHALKAARTIPLITSLSRQSLVVAEISCKVVLVCATGTGGISVHWNQIALNTLQPGISLADTAELFAILNCALSDARITYFTIKYRQLTWRPITAIR